MTKLTQTFFIGIALCTMAFAAISVTNATEPFATVQETRSVPYLTFTGVNEEGEFQLALEDAIWQAHEYYLSMGYADFIVKYQVQNTSGWSGGFAGFDTIRVTIVLPANGASQGE